MRRVDMSPDDERAVLGQNFVRAKDIGRRADFTTAKVVLRHSQEEEEVLHQAHGRPLREDRQNVKPELGGELEAGENQNPGQQAPEFSKPLRFIGLQPAQVLEQLEILDLPPQIGVATDGVVVGQGYGIETAVLGAVQNVEDADTRLLVVSRGWGVDVKIDPAPGEIGRKSGVCGDSIAGCCGVGRLRCRGGGDRRFGFRRGGGAVTAPACGRNRESPLRTRTAERRRILDSPLLPLLSIVT